MPARSAAGPADLPWRGSASPDPSLNAWPDRASVFAAADRCSSTSPEYGACAMMGKGLVPRSPAGLTRGSIFFARIFAEGELDCRVKPGNDGGDVRALQKCNDAA